LITGSAGFIGFHLAQLLMREGFFVVGYDGMNDYYDVALKQRRHAILREHNAFDGIEAMLEDMGALQAVCEKHNPDVIVHLAGQAGVRYSLENPRAYIDSNVVGTFNVMECARACAVDHLLIASTSSAYGANTKMPFQEIDKSATPLTIYAATKLAAEAMGHANSHLWKIPTTLFRFFTVYGPWGRPDMAYFKFTKSIFEGTPIDIYNHGEMQRDFTYVEDLVQGIRLLIDTPPQEPSDPSTIPDFDTLSPVGPYRMVNIGNAQIEKLMDFIEALEDAIGIKAKKNFVDMQKGDVTATWADTQLLRHLTGFAPATNIQQGTAEFVGWYRDYYGV
ncbi:MAG: NAD-dependent epimerase/dehydratase family protein, partial [Pseudomonadota bacterium]